MRPGRKLITRMRSESCTASVMLWVISSVVCAQFLLDLQHLVAQQQAGLFVQRRERLVHQQDARLGRQGAGDRHALPHPARQLRRLPPLEAAQSHHVDEAWPRSWRAARAMPCSSSGKATLSITLRQGKQDSSWNTMPIAGCGLRTRRPRPTCGRRWPGQPADHVEQGRLAAAGRADDRDELALRHAERHVVHRRHALLAEPNRLVT